MGGSPTHKHYKSLKYEEAVVDLGGVEGPAPPFTKNMYCGNLESTDFLGGPINKAPTFWACAPYK